MDMRTLGAGLCTTLLLLEVAACGNLTAGGLTGEATVVVSGDADTLSAAAAASAQPALASTNPFGPSPAGVPERASTGPALSAEEAEGEIQVKFLAYLVAEGGATTQLGTEEIQVKVDIHGRNEMDVVDRQRIPVGRYTEFRLIFTEAHAEVDGLVVNGVSVPEVDVDLQNLSLLVSRAIDLNVTQGMQAELVVDLNSLSWLDAVDPDTGVVDEAIFQGLVNVVIR